MVTYGIICSAILLATIVTLLVGMLCGYKLVKYGLNLGLKIDRYKETGELIDEDSTHIEQEMTE